ncbi:hypothetical protein P7C71_g1511, partial [Lecanoromycetidae sp. Uapishka_2]
MSTLLGMIIGDVEVEERRPRGLYEPRRKRLSFVNDRSKSRRRSSDEWALVPHSSSLSKSPTYRHRRQESDPHVWDERKLATNERFLQLEAMRLQQENQRLQQRGQAVMMERDRMRMAQEQRMMAQGIHPGMQRPQLQQLQGHPDEHRQRGLPPIPPQHHGNRGGGDPRDHRDPRIMPLGRAGGGGHQRDEFEDFGSDDSDPVIEMIDPGDDSDDERGRGRGSHRGRSPRRISRVRDDSHYPYGRSKSKGRKDRKTSKSSKKKSKKSKKHSKSLYSSDSSDSSDNEQGYVQGFKAGIKTASKTAVAIPLRTGRSRSRYHDYTTDDSLDSFDELRDYRPRLRSKSRGNRRFWGM